MKEEFEDLLRSRIAGFTQNIERIAKDRKGDRLKMKRTTAHLSFLSDDTNGLHIGMHISIDPRRLECGEDGLGGDGTFLLRIYLSPKGYAAFISDLIAFAMEFGIEGEGVDHAPIAIDGEMY